MNVMYSVIVYSHGCFGHVGRHSHSLCASSKTQEIVEFTPVLVLYDPFGVDVP